MPITHTTRRLDAPSHEREHAGLLVGVGGHFHLRAEDAGHAHHLVHRFHRLEDRVDLVGIETFVAAGRPRQIPRWTTRSGAPKRSIARSNVCFPIMPSNSAVATAGSSSARLDRVARVRPGTGRVVVDRRPGWQLLPDEAEEQLRVVDHVAHDVAGDPVVARRRIVPRSASTASTRSVNDAATRWKRSEISVMPGTVPTTHANLRQLRVLYNVC